MMFIFGVHFEQPLYLVLIDSQYHTLYNQSEMKNCTWKTNCLVAKIQNNYRTDADKAYIHGLGTFYGETSSN